MATSKAKTTAKKSSAKKTTSKPKTTAAKAEKTTRVAEPITSKSTNPVKEFFGRKYDANENILTIFKSPKIIGAILGEIIGTMLLTMVLLTLGLFNPLYLIFGILIITIAVYAFSGANINPIVTVGLMASRRMSPIRGVLYIIAQLLGAWFALLIINGFNGVGGEYAQALPTITFSNFTEEAGMFWAITMVEFIGAIIIGFAFARALVYKRSVFTFGAVVASGVFLAVLLAIVITSNCLYISENSFVLNPAVAIMYQVLPSEAANFGELMGKVMQALVTYAVFPMLGGAIGFYVSDFASKLSGQKLVE